MAKDGQIHGIPPEVFRELKTMRIPFPKGSKLSADDPRRKELHRCAIHTSKRFIYVNIWKNASCSMREMVAQTFGITAGAAKLAGRSLWQMSMPSIPRWGVAHCEGYEVIAAIRHPFDRFLSCFYNKRESPRFCRGNQIQLHASLQEFLALTCDTPDSQVDPHLRSQDWFLHSCGKQIGDTLIRFEDLPRSANKVFRRLGVPTKTPQRHTGKRRQKLGVRGNWQQRLSDSATERLYERYKTDFDRFGYSVDD